MKLTLAVCSVAFLVLGLVIGTQIGPARVAASEPQDLITPGRFHAVEAGIADLRRRVAANNEEILSLKTKVDELEEAAERAADKK